MSAMWVDGWALGNGADVFRASYVVIVVIMSKSAERGVNTIAINFSTDRPLNTCLQLLRRIGTKRTRGPHDADVLEPVTK